MTMRLLLMRHGQTHANVAGALDTAEPGLDLTPLGETQARAAAEVLRDQHLDAVFVSRLARTRQTARFVVDGRGLAPVTLPGLAEIGAGRHEMATDKESVQAYRSTVAAWIHGELDVRMPGGESGHEFLARYDAALADVATGSHRVALVVAHGAAMRVWASHRSGVGSQHPQAHDPLDNTACITLEGHPGNGWRLLGWHSDPLGGHLLEDTAAPDPTGRPVD